ncbi:MAG TPA: hypothetical protein VF006_18700 [Longimicrobium sp.]
MKPRRVPSVQTLAAGIFAAVALVTTVRAQTYPNSQCSAGTTVECFRGTTEECTQWHEEPNRTVGTTTEFGTRLCLQTRVTTYYYYYPSSSGSTGGGGTGGSGGTGGGGGSAGGGDDACGDPDLWSDDGAGCDRDTQNAT